MKKTTEKFREWIEKKIEVEFTQNDKNLPDVGEFWRYYEGMNVGNEISKDGKNLRPCVVLKNNTGNKLILIAPLTSKYHHRLSEYYIQIPDYIGLNTVSFAIVNQIKLIDKNRLSGVVRGTIRSRSIAQQIKQSYIKFIK